MGAFLACALLLAGALQSATPWAEASLLVLRRDWTPTTCLAGCVEGYPNSFSIDALFIAYASGEAQTACSSAGKAGLSDAALQGAGLTRASVGCAWQNWDPDGDLDEAWEWQWTHYGTCTPMRSAAGYLQLGLALDRQFPLPQRLPARVESAALAAAVEAAFGAPPQLGCTEGGQLRNIQLCFDTDGLKLIECPWEAAADCRGELAVPRNDRAANNQDCQAYYPSSPVRLDAPVTVPEPSPPPPPEEASPPPPEEASPPPPEDPSPPPPKDPSPPPPKPSGADGVDARRRPPPGSPRLPPRPNAVPQSPPPPPPQPATSSGEQAVTSSAANGSGTSSTTSNTSSSSGGSTSTAAMVGALAGGIVGGIAVGAAVLTTGYWLYRRGLRDGQAVATASDGKEGELCSCDGLSVVEAGGASGSGSTSGSATRGVGSGLPPRPPALPLQCSHS